MEHSLTLMKRGRGGGAPKGCITEYGVEIAQTGELINYFTLNELERFFADTGLTRDTLRKAALFSERDENYMLLAKYRIYKTTYKLGMEE